MSKFSSNGSQDAPGSHFPESLRLRLSEDLHLTGKAKRTHDGYIRAVRQLSDFAGCSPDQVNEQHVRQFFLRLKSDRNFASGLVRAAFSGIKFFFTHTCKRDWEIIKMLKLQNITTLPEVLTIEQGHRRRARLGPCPSWQGSQGPVCAAADDDRSTSAKLLGQSPAPLPAVSGRWTKT
ncbi:site-specific integrase [Rhodopirellula bahusiensis]|uniref:site-specific integrase n=1 Tax=Rhodopirellula bahusiensis TaxID=2014065 RepID=UPI003262F587